VKPGIKKVASGKTMRVATLFTGAAAYAAAFAPAAAAGTVHAAGAGHQARLDGRTLTALRLHDTMHGARPDDSGSIGWTSSCTRFPHWVHIYSPAVHTCVGFKGTLDFVTDLGQPIGASTICGGNNYGWYKSVGDRKGYYHQGTTYATLPVDNIKSIHISGWKGTDACPAL
jgi:hypothetical protein